MPKVAVSRLMTALLPALACTLALAALSALSSGGCKRDRANDSAGGGGTGAKVRLTLDWKPEPEFGGFYAARENGVFARHGLDVEVKTAGEGAPAWQLVDRGATEFATTAADQVVIARANGHDVVALFAVYQTSPQGIMVHRARGFTKIEDVFANPGTLAAENNPWLKYLRKRFGGGPRTGLRPPQVKITGYSGGVAAFLAKPDHSQQCFIFSEPILAAKQGGDPQTFLIADAGYNPYTTVVIAKGDYVRKNPQIVASLVAACREGWQAYLDDPGPTNAVMGKLNRDMDAETFAAGAKAQEPLVRTRQTKAGGLGTMTKERWAALGQQLVEAGVITEAPPAESCFAEVGPPAGK
jgi:NitT/TauT family transport system substrate-binding protein